MATRQRTREQIKRYFSEQLRNARLFKDITIQEVSRDTKITVQQLHNLEKGVCEPKLYTIYKLERYFGALLSDDWRRL